MDGLNLLRWKSTLDLQFQSFVWQKDPHNKGAIIGVIVLQLLNLVRVQGLGVHLLMY